MSDLRKIFGRYRPRTPDQPLAQLKERDNLREFVETHVILAPGAWKGGSEGWLPAHFGMTAKRIPGGLLWSNTPSLAIHGNPCTSVDSMEYLESMESREARESIVCIHNPWMNLGRKIVGTEDEGKSSCEQFWVVLAVLLVVAVRQDTL